MRFSVGFELTAPVRTAILGIPGNAWAVALDQHGGERANGAVAEITDRVELRRSLPRSMHVDRWPPCALAPADQGVRSPA
jgi:hypothetical protein